MIWHTENDITIFIQVSISRVEYILTCMKTIISFYEFLFLCDFRIIKTADRYGQLCIYYIATCNLDVNVVFL